MHDYDKPHLQSRTPVGSTVTWGKREDAGKPCNTRAACHRYVTVILTEPPHSSSHLARVRETAEPQKVPVWQIRHQLGTPRLGPKVQNMCAPRS